MSIIKKETREIIRSMSERDKVELEIAYQAVVADCVLWDKEDRERQQLEAKHQRERDGLDRQQKSDVGYQQSVKVKWVNKSDPEPKLEQPGVAQSVLKSRVNQIGVTDRPSDLRYGWQRAGLDQPKWDPDAPLAMKDGVILNR